MKRGLIILVLLFALPLVSAVPTFNLFSGDVLCDSSVQTGYSIYAYVNNGTSNFTEPGSVSSAGEYAIVVGATNLYNVSFYVDNVLITTVNYNDSLWIRNLDIGLPSSHDLCDDGGGDPGDGGGDNNGGDTNPPSGGPSAYCGDGTCDTDESCVDCSEDCGQCPPPADNWDLSGATVNVPQDSLVEVISIGGDYELVIEGTTTPFSIWEVSETSAKVDINGVTYEILFEDSKEVAVGDYSVLVSYLANQDGKAKLSFKNAGIRAVSAFPGIVIVYWVFGIIILGVGIFFLIKWWKNRDTSKPKTEVSEKKQSLKPAKNIKKKVVNKKDRNLLSGPEE